MSISSSPPDPSSRPEATSAPTPNEPFLPYPFTHAQPAPLLITQGAEALLYKTHFLSPETPAALKARPSKAYRHPILDARLTKQRVLAEARILVKLSALRGDRRHNDDAQVNVPAVLSLEWDVARKVRGLHAEQRGPRGANQPGGGAGAWLLMEWIEGTTVKELLRRFDTWRRHVASGDTVGAEEIQKQEDDIKQLLRRIGRAVGNMHHRGGVVHGDLTSSNVMVRPLTTNGQLNEETRDDLQVNGTQQQEQDLDSTRDTTPSPPDVSGEIVLIDFGLATQSTQEEDRAVDLYVLERAFGSTHPRQEHWFDTEVLQSQDGYRGSFKGANVVLKRLEDVRLRGRKRSMLG
ncbi:hypothetical protein PV10_01621 [Exophiala mesophila]|uniref:EKC/KEOPS complex subunit BUD32 n=1 Tax=Exophiala mesophila TaxID=212818 RepID=A0A0D1X7S2_EXOME|nr:uncharacterized protein PV10_01621 [Exophiala mesophila]KIV97920.1 hypothetical protein PV10_01621 [Exophiala mesophila]